MCTTSALADGVREIPGVDDLEREEETVSFTVFWGGVDEEGYRATYEGIANFTSQYGVGVTVVTGDATRTTWRVVRDGEPFTYDLLDDVYVG